MGFHADFVVYNVKLVEVIMQEWWWLY